ncbi:23S rRNA (adenine(2503)-C(2))-methyltransferase RlmN [Thermovenabulum gondwanense]|uniref:Probable dual-specificity RNA methyltransferase RlmN n=1 Tax=Thermovenabulum gondwanense TaxID=520767 RepID=A0A162MMZ4_9FIRM|nr:23S rRNA (adenine(2503)-C(2))-methyltransferase RlmN [Thermovenabulum gondwanense]KYO66752.1 putative dual-specificity RNA methyltransferase RlmN [Thermovenabulum gondwanense]
MEKKNLKSMDLNELTEYVRTLGEKDFRARQIYRWIYKGVSDFESMSDLPKNLIVQLKKYAYISEIKILKKVDSKKDKTSKYIFLLEDGNIIESVKMEYSYGVSVCVSSQVGCAMGCAFCASTLGGIVRNLEAWEMVDQILQIEKQINKRVSHVVVMGSGEPLLNYTELIKFLRLLNNPLGLNISLRKVTVSTCGIVPYIYKLAEENMPITLSISLHAPFDDLRNKLMPINRKYNISQLLEACNFYIMKTKRRISFEYILISGVNDGEECAKKLADLLRGMLCHVNLIPLNPVKEKLFKGSDPRAIRRFEKVLEENRIPITIRAKMGSDIEAACGQLRWSLLKEVEG